MLSASAGGLVPSGKRPGDVKTYCLFSRSQTRKGGMYMELSEIAVLLSLLGGAIYGTFQISWTIFKEIHNNKK